MQRSNEVDKDKTLWKLAKRRAAFRSHAITYCLVNIMFWVIWAATDFGGFPWPLIPAAGWGIGLVGDYMQAYQMPKNWTEEEYEKLLDEQEQRYWDRRLADSDWERHEGRGK